MQDKDADAKALLERAVKINEKALGADAPDTLRVAQRPRIRACEEPQYRER